DPRRCPPTLGTRFAHTDIAPGQRVASRGGQSLIRKPKQCCSFDREPAVIDLYQQIASSQGAWPMGDDENGATLHEAFQRLQNGRFRFDVYCAGWFVGVSRQGHINQSVKVRPRRIDSSLVAGEAPWSESNTVMPSDNMLRKEHA